MHKGYFKNPVLIRARMSMHDGDFYTENLIIGSGYGGSVCGLRMAQAGHKATLLEMGVNWQAWQAEGNKFSSMLMPKSSSTWLQNRSIAPFMNVHLFAKKYTGVLDRMRISGMNVYAGRGAGGGSIANGGMAVQPKAEYFSEIFPQLSGHEFYSKYFPLVNKQLRVNTISPSFYASSPWYKFARVGQAEAERAGFTCIKVPNVYSFNHMEQEAAGLAPRSATACEVIYGNNHGKASLDKTYLRQALDSGMINMLCLHRADGISQLPGGDYKVQVSVLNTAGAVVRRREITCSRLFLNAGSLGSSLLVLKAMHNKQLPQVPHAGMHWGNNGNIMLGRNMVNTIFNRVGSAQFKKLEGSGTGRRQATIPVLGVDNWADAEHSFFTEISPLPMGFEAYTALYLMINKVPRPGSLHYNAGSNGLHINFPAENLGHATANGRYFIKKMIAANGGTTAGLLFKRGYGANICYHPLGGMALGHSTDNYGRVLACKNLYVTDGALVPASIGVNPFLTITALAEHCIENILANDF